MAFPDDFSLEFRDLDTDQYVYHYTRRETAFQHILPSRTIRLGPLSQTNDPRETKSWTFGLSGGSDDFPTDLAKRKLEIDRLTSIFDAAQKIRANCKVLCVTMDDPAYDPHDFHEFKRGFSHSRMWDQYGEKHTGCCLIFHRPRLHEAIFKELEHRCTLYFGAVEYRDEVAGPQIFSEALPEEEINRVGLDQFLLDHRHEHHRIFFFRKSQDWSQEFEYRWIALGDNDDPELVSVEAAIAGLVTGVDFPDSELPLVISSCKNLNIPAAQIAWENGIPILKTKLC